ncbi:citrate synthase [Prauserella sediminis]|uniref:citrate synthase (unknown stereospecificity) n=1 Tax=Prauserella sediminis TaxID=577680 RepID=A0A839XH26_9PSEU|nr:citryl-CoA lyase [Prauserella sediminis]MBB3662590.1 citrate synthase [Prauserella sediminis]
MTVDGERHEAAAYWATNLVRIQPGEIALRGYPIEDLIGRFSFVDIAWLMVRGQLPTQPESRLLEAALTAAVDHGPQAPSIAAARMAATCGVGLNNAMATGVNLLGDVHGGAGQQCMEVLQTVRDRVPAAGSLETAVERVLAEHRYVPGFGHRFHPRDPRRDPLLGLVEQARDDGVVAGEHLAAAVELERQLARKSNKPIPMNIDGATAVIYGELGFTPELARGLFVLSRSVGILAHAWEERQSGTRIKGPVPRSVLADYTGPDLREPPR